MTIRRSTEYGDTLRQRQRYSLRKGVGGRVSARQRPVPRTPSPLFPMSVRRSRTPTATHTVSYTSSPTCVHTTSFTATPTILPTPSFTLTQTQTRTAVPTHTTTASTTSTATLVPTRSMSPTTTATVTPLPTLTPTRSGSATCTPVPTTTLIGTRTPTPSGTLLFPLVIVGMVPAGGAYIAAFPDRIEILFSRRAQFGATYSQHPIHMNTSAGAVVELQQVRRPCPDMAPSKLQCAKQWRLRGIRRRLRSHRCRLIGIWDSRRVTEAG